MPTISAHIDKHLKNKITSKAHKEDKSVSDLVKEALNEIDFDKEEHKEIDDESKTKEEREAISPILKEISNLTTRVGEIEDGIIELGKLEARLGEIIIRWTVDQEKKRIKEIQREDAHRTHLHNLTINALEKTTSKNLEECKGH